MLTLRLTQFTEAEDKYRVEVALEGNGRKRAAAALTLTAAALASNLRNAI